MDNSWFGLGAQILGTIAVVLLAASASGHLRKGLETIPVSKIAWVILIVVSAYFVLAVPYVGTIRENAGKFEYSSETADSDGPGYIRDHHRRIETLEAELKETKDELKSLVAHYRSLVWIAFYSVLYFGLFSAFGRKRPSERVFDLDSFKQ